MSWLPAEPLLLRMKCVGLRASMRTRPFISTVTLRLSLLHTLLHAVSSAQNASISPQASRITIRHTPAAFSVLLADGPSQEEPPPNPEDRLPQNGISKVPGDHLRYVGLLDVDMPEGSQKLDLSLKV